MLGQQKLPVLLLLISALPVQTGCVALNIPSHRFHDPVDRGGLFGHWRRGSSQAAHPHGQPPLPADVFHNEGDPHNAGGFCLDGGPLEVDPLDPSLDVNGNPKEPDVPWPKFFPVPTRPVFGVGQP